MIFKGRKLTKNDILAFTKQNTLSTRLINMYIDKFDVLIEDLLHFMSSIDLDEKLRILFKIYDFDGDGVITNVELFDFLKALNNGALEDRKIQNIVDKTFAELGEYKNEINYEEFKSILVKNNKNLLSAFKCVK